MSDKWGILAMVSAPISLESMSIRATTVLTALAAVVFGFLSYWVHANDGDIDDLQKATIANTQAISGILEVQKQQRVQQDQILQETRDARREASETHDAVIRLEERLRQIDAHSERRAQ